MAEELQSTVPHCVQRIGSRVQIRAGTPDQRGCTIRRAKKDLRYEWHARQQMARRWISEEQVEQVVDNPERIRAADRPGALVYEKALKKHCRLSVVVEEMPNFLRIVTVWRD